MKSVKVKNRDLKVLAFIHPGEMYIRVYGLGFKVCGNDF